MRYRFTKDRRMTPREQPEPSAEPYVRPLMSQLLLLRAEWWAVPDDFSTPHITAQAHMASLFNTYPEVDTLYFQAQLRVEGFEYMLWLCLLEANFQFTDGDEAKP